MGQQCERMFRRCESWTGQLVDPVTCVCRCGLSRRALRWLPAGGFWLAILRVIFGDYHWCVVFGHKTSQKFNSRFVIWFRSVNGAGARVHVGPQRPTLFNPKPGKTNSQSFAWTSRVCGRDRTVNLDFCQNLCKSLRFWQKCARFFGVSNP